MQIVEIRLRPYSLALRRPLRAAWGVLTRREGWVVQLRDETGGWGLGEAAPLPGFGMETPAACAAALRAAGTRLAGRVLTLPGRLAAADWQAPAPTGFLGEVSALLAQWAGTPAARHGLEQALLDRAAARAGLPLTAWLHPRAAVSVAANATLGAETPDELAQAARAAVQAGFGTLKLKVATGTLAEDLRRIAAVRRAVGEEVALRLDANGAWNLEQARRALAELAPLGIEYLEQPLPREALDDMARLAREGPVAIAADESADTPAAARAVIARRAAQVLILKPMVLGGLLPALTLGQEAIAAGLGAVVTTTLEGAIGRLGALHMAAALAGLAPAPRKACGLATGGWLAADLLAAPPADGPSMTLPRQPGLGWLPGRAGEPDLLC